MLRSAALALALAIGTPALAQQGAVGMTSGYLTGNGGYGAALDLRAALYAQPYNSQSFSFAPDPALRMAVTRNVLADIARKDQALASALGKNPFGTFGPALAAHDIRDTQIDDALALMMLTLWDSANASTAETTPGQANGVKRQARALLARSLPGGRPATGSLQEASDSIYLSALMVSVLHAKVMEGRNPSSVAQLQDMARRESMASFGIDFSRLGLTEQGFVAR